MLGGKESPPRRKRTWQLTAVSRSWAYNGLIPFNNLAGFPLFYFQYWLLAFKHDNVAIILIYFSICICTP